MVKTCREELIEAIKVIINKKRKNEFSPQEAIAYMKLNGTSYQEKTIRTHITSRCCKNAPQNHQTKYEDLERIGVGLYKLLGI